MALFTTMLDTQTTLIDPTKHVNFVEGMVLGVDDFVQEYTYHHGRLLWAMRDLIGYGVISGLKVESDIDGLNGPRIKVQPGTALSPHGELICVSQTQCASLNAWLGQQKKSFGTNLSLYILLCYDSCQTDDVPIAGEPCRADSDLLKPSRITDSFSLQLSETAPNQQEEQEVRDFVAWLRQVQLTDQPGAATLQEFLDAIQASHGASPPDILIGSPPEALRIPMDQASEYLRTAFRFWVEELRPSRSGSAGCASLPTEGCLQLARLDLTLAGTNPPTIATDGVMIVNSQAPFLLHLQMIQEWLLTAQERALPSDQLPTPVVFDSIGAVGFSNHYARADHEHPGPPDPIPPHVANTSAHLDHLINGDVTGTIGATHISMLQGIPVADGIFTTGEGEGGVDRFVLKVLGGEWRPAPDEIGLTELIDDVNTSGVSATVVALQHTPIAAVAPVKGQVLKFDGIAWSPDTDLVGTGAGSSPIIAAGQFGTKGNEVFATGGLQAFLLSVFPNSYLLSFSNFKPGQAYIVKGTPCVDYAQTISSTFEFLGESGDIQAQDAIQILVKENDRASKLYEKVGSNPANMGLIVRVQQVNQELVSRGFMVEISQFVPGGL